MKSFFLRTTLYLFLISFLLQACHVQQPISSDRFAQDVRSDMPFRVSTLSIVPGHEDVFSFRCENRVDMLPDYEVNNEGAVMIYRTTFAPMHATQPANVIWRNIVINRKAQRVLCIDRLIQNNKTFGYVYVLQSENKDYTNAYHWDVSDQRLLLTVANVIEEISHLSITRLELMLK